MPATKRKFPPAADKNYKKPKSTQPADLSKPNDAESLSVDENDYTESSEDDLDNLSDDDAGAMDSSDDSDEKSDSNEDVAAEVTKNNNNDQDATVLPVKRKPLSLDPHKEAASREAHLKQKEKLNERKSAKPHADILARSKSLWAQINRKKVPKSERQKIIEELYKLISGSVVEIIFKHDASRVVQACFKFGSEAQRTTILQELKGRLVELSKSTYGKFLVVKMLYYGSAAHKEAILSEIHGNVRKLIKHKEAAYVVEDAFREYTTPTQQDALVSEMYGAEYSVFEGAGGKSLAKLLEESPEKRDTIMKNLWDAIQSSVKKGSIGFTIIHRALLSFLKSANNPEKAEAVELVKELLPEIVHTKDGSEAACYIIALAAAKDRKAIMKSFREHIVKAMTDEYGWMAVVALFMCVDDTVLLTKAFSPDISKKCVDLFEDRFARKVFLYTLGGLQGRYFTDREMKIFKTVQEWKQTTSKKADDLRRSEILQSLSDSLVSTLVENLDGILSDPNASSLLVEILIHAPTDRDAAVDAVIEKFNNDPSTCLLEHSPRFLKTLVQGGFFNKTTKSIEKTDSSLHFAEKFAPVVTDRAADWATGDGSFVVLALLESLVDEGPEKAALKKALIAQKATLQKASDAGNKGAKIILLKI